MSYKARAKLAFQPLSAEEMGFEIVMPSTTRAEIRKVGDFVALLDEDISATNWNDKAAWDLFVREWEDFEADVSNVWDRAWFSTFERTREFGRRAEQYKDRFVADGFLARGPKTLPVPPSYGSSFVWVGIAAVSALGIAFLIKD